MLIWNYEQKENKYNKKSNSNRIGSDAVADAPGYRIGTAGCIADSQPVCTSRLGDTAGDERVRF